ncbi:MAG: hypothetical protein MZV63_25965 [Marinilabiliales bacterium]|nr:hypothetical protein [Marinilabiliales bacterium]
MKDVGRIAPLDLLKVDVRVAAAEQRRSKAGRDRDLISLHLAVLLGRDLGESLPSVAGLPALPQPETSGMDQMVSEAAARRPELNALLQEIARRQAELISGQRGTMAEFGGFRSLDGPQRRFSHRYHDFILPGVFSGRANPQSTLMDEWRAWGPAPPGPGSVKRSPGTPTSGPVTSR